ncbi:MAG: NAD/FAD-binding protein [Alphaproteobacteria bacterium]|nr:NAD/FAD-binding protein [Alphaproteobacteria bacterium]
MRRVAVIGSGVAGLGAAARLAPHADITVFEKDTWIGGHSHTVDVCWGPHTIPVDTGFIVYNEKNYPNLTRLFSDLKVPTKPSDMSFGVSLDNGWLEYGTERYNAIFGQRRNLLRPRFLGLLLDILRFFRTAPRVLAGAEGAEPTLGDWLARAGFGRAFIEDHLLPMAAAIWSCPTAVMLDFPLITFLRFFHNHGLLTYDARPAWRTVEGGSREYVRRLIGPFADRIRSETPVRSIRRDATGVSVATDAGSLRFDAVIVATHGDQALRLLADAGDDERRVLGAFGTQENIGYLHSDADLMPRRQRVWSSWNYLGDRGQSGERRVFVTYWMNRLQRLDTSLPIFLTLNPTRPPRQGLIHRELAYEHPVFDRHALAAQAELPAIQGTRRTWFCGSYCGHGFHEDALSSGLAAAEGVLASFAEPRPMAAD